MPVEAGSSAFAGRSEAPAGGLARAPLLWLATAFWSGIALSGAAGAARDGLASGFAAALLALAAALLVLPGLMAQSRPGVATALLLAAAFAAGLLSGPAPASASSLAAAVRALGADRMARPVLLAGVLRGEAEDFGNRKSLRIRVDTLAANRQSWPVQGEARITVRGARTGHLARLSRGARVRIWSRVSEPRPLGNPGGHRSRGPIALFGSAKSGLLVREIEPGPAPWRAVRRVRAAVRERLHSSGLSHDAVAVAAAMLVGDRALATPELERSFRDAGTLHLMAVSGLHVGMLSLMLYGAALLGGARRRTAFSIVLAVLPLYAAICGGAPSVVRAVLMAAVLILGMRRGLVSEAVNGLGAAAISLLAFSPWNAFDAGFQLSFAATLTIIAALRPRDPAEVSWEAPGRWRAFLLGPLFVTLAAQLATFPIVAWHFGRVVFGGLLVALPAALLGGPVLGLGYGWLLCGRVPLLGEALRWMLEVSAKALIGLSEWGASLSFGAFPVARPAFWWLLVWLALALLALWRRGRGRLLPAGLIVVLALSSLPSRDPADGTLRLTALDVGMGDALVIALPEGGAVLVDAGTDFEGWSAGEAVVVPFLAHEGHRRLRGVMATHGDLDHVGGFPAVFRDLRVDEVWEGVGTTEDDRPAVRRMREEQARRRIPLRLLRAGERFALGGAGFSVLLAGEAGAGPNERSLVLAVDYAGRRLLLTGDIGETSERILIGRYGAALRADVLKVGHHGSRFSTSRAFVSAVAPEVALVSTRADPRRGLPDEGVLERLRRAGARVFRTDHSGAITVGIGPDGSLSVETFRPLPAAEEASVPARTVPAFPVFLHPSSGIRSRTVPSFTRAG